MEDTSQISGGSIIEKILNWSGGHHSNIPNSVEPDDTINYYLAPGEVLIQCPYQVRHKIRTTRMARHILKCRRNSWRGKEGNVELFQCMYSDVHFVPGPELKYHENQCSERFALEETRAIERKHAPSAMPLHRVEVFGDLWDWDDFTGAKSIGGKLQFDERYEDVPVVEFIKIDESAHPTESYYGSVNIEEIKSENSEVEFCLEKVASTTNISLVETDRAEFGYTTDDEESQAETDVPEFSVVPDHNINLTKEVDKSELFDDDEDEDPEPETEIAEFSNIPHEMMERLDEDLYVDLESDEETPAQWNAKSLPKDFENELTRIATRYNIYCGI